MNKATRLILGGAAATLALGAVAAPAMAAPSSPVPATKAGIAAWVDQASTSAMTTKMTSFEETTKTCTIATNQASDCTAKIPGNPDTQTVTNADASRKWWRDLPNGKWKTNKEAADENPVSNVSRFYLYNPFEPWTADAKLGVTWSMKVHHGTITINSKIKNLGEDQTPVNTVVINQDGSGFSLTGKDTDGNVMDKTVGKFAPASTKVVVPPAS